MTVHRLFFLVLLYLASSIHGNIQPKNTGGDKVTGDGKVVCYVMRTTFMSVAAIPANLCTHIIMAFVEITGHELSPPSSLDLLFYQGLMKLKESFPSLSIMISLQKDFSAIIDAPLAEKKQLAQSISQFCMKYGFDGVDFDWEPVKNPTSQQKQGYMDVITIVRQTLDEETRKTNSPSRLISAALMPSIPRSQKVYDIPGLAKVLDFATAMTYDYHLYIANVDNQTSYNSPLYSPTGERKDYGVVGTIQNYISLGMPASKLLLGFPTYGRTYILKDANSHGLHSPAVDKGVPGPVRKLRGVYSYQDTCVMLKAGATPEWDNTSKVPYLYSGKIWASYDNTRSAAEKCEYVKSACLGGVGIWALHLDDFDDMCGQGKFPLVTALRDSLRGDNSLGFQPHSHSADKLDIFEFGFV